MGGIEHGHSFAPKSREPEAGSDLKHPLTEKERLALDLANRFPTRKGRKDAIAMSGMTRRIFGQCLQRARQKIEREKYPTLSLKRIRSAIGRVE